MGVDIAALLPQSLDNRCAVTHTAHPRSYDDGRRSLCLGYIDPTNQESRVA